MLAQAEFLLFYCSCCGQTFKIKCFFSQDVTLSVPDDAQLQPRPIRAPDP